MIKHFFEAIQLSSLPVKPKWPGDQVVGGADLDEIKARRRDDIELLILQIILRQSLQVKMNLLYFFKLRELFCDLIKFKENYYQVLPHDNQSILLPNDLSRLAEIFFPTIISKLNVVPWEVHIRLILTFCIHRVFLQAFIIWKLNRNKFTDWGDFL